ncbi:MAG: acetolactate synthase [Rikenellaceae bacterium]
MGVKLNQLSIFLENKIGSLYEVMDILSGADIRILASTVSDTTEFGILRMVTSDNERAYTLLRAASKSCSRSEVMAILCDSSANTFYKELKGFASEGIVVEYMYCFADQHSAVLIMRVNDLDKALAVAADKGIRVLSNEDLGKI